MVTAERKDIYEMLHPETRNGGDRKSSAIKSERRLDVLIDTPSFIADTAAKTSVTERTVQRSAQIGRNLSTEAVAMIRDCGAVYGHFTTPRRR